MLQYWIQMNYILIPEDKITPEQATNFGKTFDAAGEELKKINLSFEFCNCSKYGFH